MNVSRKEIIWTPDLAYAVGLITTDGSLSRDGRHFDFTSNDKDLIETFKQCLGLTNKIVPKKSGFTGKLSSFHVQFGDVVLYRWLTTIGLMPKKSKVLRSLAIPDKYFFYFLRGHLDGDGMIRKFPDPVYPKSIRLYTAFHSASLPHLMWINGKIKQLLNISGSSEKLKGEYRLTFSKHSSITLLNEIYPNASVPCLVRKLIIAAEFVGMMSPR